MKKITVPELKARGYLVCDVKDLGRCVVVPGAEFDPDWAVCLEDAGYRCVDDVLDGAPVTFVVLGGARSNEVMEVGKVEKTNSMLKGPRWTGAEDAQLLSAYDALCAQGKKRGAVGMAKTVRLNVAEARLALESLIKACIGNKETS